MADSLKLLSHALRYKADLDDFDFSDPLIKSKRSILGQERAQCALEFGIAMQHPGYNIYVMGEPESGRLSMITSLLEFHAPKTPVPLCYAYVNNFDNPREPEVITLTAGTAEQFCADIEQLIDRLLTIFPAIFESLSYQQKKTSIIRNFNRRYNAALNQVEKKARSMNIALFRESETVGFAPIRDNKSLDEDEFAQLAQDERDLFLQQTRELEDDLAEKLLELPQWRREMGDQLNRLEGFTINQAIEPLITELSTNWKDNQGVQAFLGRVQKDLRYSLIDIIVQPTASDQSDTTKRNLMRIRYLPNILVEHKPDNGAPIIYEPHPSYLNLFGRIEYVSENGVLVTNYRHIRCGALHRANGGYLIIEAEKLLSAPFVWESLKRALKTGRIEIETPLIEFGVNTITLKPAVIDLNVKIILLGPHTVYYLLQEFDDEFNEMFKILADFDHQIHINPDIIRQFVALMNNHANQSGAAKLTQAALESLIEHSARLAEHQHRLSARINDTLEIINEAEQLRTATNSATLDKNHILQALEGRERRSGRIAQHILQEMLDQTILLATEGKAIGKINGLTVLKVGNSSFGAPARFTATVHAGSHGIVDIEREAELGQSIHSKGVLILTGYLGHCYAQDFPLTLSASIAVEQSYGYIDGDSAALAEFCCLISALTNTPIKQSFAITGSINQYGEVQAIGGVNEKIEGFFKLCQARNLNGQHAVIIPASNQCNLMLKQEVIDAVEQGQFAIYSVTTASQALELLTGLSARERDEQGQYPSDSVHFKAVSRLREIAEITMNKTDIAIK